MKEIIRKCILFLSICLFIYSAFNLIKAYIDYKEISDQQEELVDQFVEPIKTETDKEDNKEEVAIIDPYSRFIDFRALNNLNKDVIGWIYIPDTRVDEPILKGRNNDSYLRTNLYGEYMVAGTIFIDENDGKDFNDDKTIIYGHNMTNGTRFGQLSKFQRFEFFDEHPNVYIYKPDGSIYVYDIFVAKTIDASSPLYYDIESYSQFVSDIQNGAPQARSIPKKKAPIILLSTCVNSDLTRRYVISARLKEIVKK